MKTLSLLAALAVSIAVLSGCGKSAEVTQTFNLPRGLEDCKVYTVTGDNAFLTVVRCPNSSVSTSYLSGKVTQRTFFIEDKGDLGD